MIKNSNLGFTLIEMLLVVALIAILITIVIVAINPYKQLGDTRNAARAANLNAIVDAVYQYMIDNKGIIISSLPTTETEVCKTAAASCSGFVDLSMLTAQKKYLVSIPIDPLVSTGNGTGYKIFNDEGRLTASAPYAEQGKIIVITK